MFSNNWKQVEKLEFQGLLRIYIKKSSLKYFRFMMQKAFYILDKKKHLEKLTRLIYNRVRDAIKVKKIFWIVEWIAIKT